MSKNPTGLKVTVIKAERVYAVAIKWSDGSQSDAWFGPFDVGASHTFVDSGPPEKTVNKYGFMLLVHSQLGIVFAGNDFNFQATYQTVGN